MTVPEDYSLEVTYFLLCCAILHDRAPAAPQALKTQKCIQASYKQNDERFPPFLHTLEEDSREAVFLPNIHHWFTS